MGHHKRGRPKNARAGCLMCKPHKANGAKDKLAPSVQRRLQDAGGEPETDEVSRAEIELLALGVEVP